VTPAPYSLSKMVSPSVIQVKFVVVDSVTIVFPVFKKIVVAKMLVLALPSALKVRLVVPVNANRESFGLPLAPVP